MLDVSLRLFAACGSGFLGFPNWYRGLPGGDVCEPRIDNINNIWLIVVNVTEIALRLAGLVAIGFIIFGGVMYITSQGSPDRITQAKDILVNAVIGLVIAIMATAIVSFIAGRF